MQASAQIDAPTGTTSCVPVHGGQYNATMGVSHFLRLALSSSHPPLGGHGRSFKVLDLTSIALFDPPWGKETTGYRVWPTGEQRGPRSLNVHEDGTPVRLVPRLPSLGTHSILGASVKLPGLQQVPSYLCLCRCDRRRRVPSQPQRSLARKVSRRAIIPGCQILRLAN